jgi:NADH dehydrogenase FAD-containing subunit
VFELSYDILVIAVGSKSNNFGIKVRSIKTVTSESFLTFQTHSVSQGVDQYCYPLRQLSDARAIRNRLIECFERASG